MQERGWIFWAIWDQYSLNKQKECFMEELVLFRVEVCIDSGITEKGAGDLREMSSIIKISEDILRGEKITGVIRTEQKKFPFREYKFLLQSVSYFEPLKRSVWAHGERLLANL